MSAQAPPFLTELEVALRRQARLGQPIGYLALAAALGMAGPQRIHRLTHALEVLARRDHAAGRPLLATLAVGRSGLPGRGFFQLLSELGRYDGPDAGEEAGRWHRAELQAAIDHWGRGGPSPWR